MKYPTSQGDLNSPRYLLTLVPFQASLSNKIPVNPFPSMSLIQLTTQPCPAPQTWPPALAHLYTAGLSLSACTTLLRLPKAPRYLQEVILHMAYGGLTI